ncbi:hypothetical protein FHG87_007640 [Trinorchestia longiramus]|nr:hypothetical protein FHG87_007640 [Trinorchestia longiramus]
MGQMARFYYFIQFYYYYYYYYRKIGLTSSVLGGPNIGASIDREQLRFLHISVGSIASSVLSNVAFLMC